MKTQSTFPTVAQMFDSVKSSPPGCLLTSPNSMIHHNNSRPYKKVIISYPLLYKCRHYGVSSSQRVLSSSLFIKKYDLIRDCLAGPLGLTAGQREVSLGLLRFFAYYGSVYVKASQLADIRGCSKATFWRTIRILEGLGLLERVNRYILRPHAQISNLYLLQKLAIVIARYLAEHGTAFLGKWLTPVLAMPAREFYRWVFQTPGIRAGPYALALVGPEYAITEVL